MSYRSGRNRRARAGVVSLVLSAALLPSLSGCSDAGPTSPSQFVASSLSLILPPEIEEGQTVQASLGSDGAGAIWVSSDPTVATVDGRGMIRGKKAGEVQILAAKGGNSANARLKVNGMKVDISPDSATIASVGGTAQLEALVTYKDGTPVQSPDLQWSSTNDGIATVDGGGKVVGRAVGLALIAVLSSGRSDTVPVRIGQAAVASVAVAPSSATLDVGKAVQLSASVRDTEGNLVPSARVSWTSSNSSVAVVDATGGVTALAGGSATVTAAFQGKSGLAQISVNAPASAPASPPPSSGGASGGYSNEPSGMVPLTTHFGASVQEAGWTSYNPWGHVGVADDADSPASSPRVLQFTYPKGMEAGYGVGGVYFNGGSRNSDPLRANGTPAREMFVGMYWKASPGWKQNDTGLTKLFYTFQWNERGERNDQVPFIAGGGGWSAGEPWYIMLGNTDGPTTYDNRYPNRQKVDIYSGRWYKMEFYFKASSAQGAPDGVMRWWVNGTLVGEHTNVKMPVSPFTEFHLDPVWGGGGGFKDRDEYMRYDNIYISVR